MSLVNYSTREITCKVVYYGPARSGKTTNLQYIHAHLPENRRGRMISLATEADRTLFFDLLPLDLGSISGYRTRFQLYTVPGQVYYDATRKLVLRGADGVVFVADSREEMEAENLESFRNMQEGLLEQGRDPRAIPLCLQYNKRDLPGVVPVEQMNRVLNYRNLPSFASRAITGTGVFETLKAVSALVLRSLARDFSAPPSPVY